MSSQSRTASTVINAPASAIFDVVADPRQHPRIDGSGTVRDSVSGPERLSLGAEFGMGMKMGAPYKIKNKVVEFEDNRLIAWRHVGQHRWRYELEANPESDGGGTLVTETWDLSHCPRPMRAALSGLFGKKTQTALTQTLARLKEAAETDAGPGFA